MWIVSKPSSHPFPGIRRGRCIRFFDMYAENLTSRQPVGDGGAHSNNSVLSCFALSYTIWPTKRDRDVTIVRLLLNKNLVIHNSPRIQFTAHHRSNRTSENQPDGEEEKGDRKSIPQISIHKVRLEVELQCEFQITRRANRARNLAKRRRGRRPTHTRRREAGMIGEVEELRAEIEILMFRQVELLANRGVPVEEARGINYADARAAERANIG